MSIVAEIRRALPQARFAYLCDNAYFPYGTKADAALLAHFLKAMRAAIEQVSPTLIVTACNTISTICLPELRAATPIPVVGVVPAVKPAATLSKHKTIGLLATPATIDRPYTNDLIARHAADCRVLKLGSAELVAMAEAKLLGHKVNLERLREILSPFLTPPAAERPDVVVLACTHFPLLRAELEAISPPDIAWIDSGEAVARRVVEVMSKEGIAPPTIGADLALTTASAPDELRRALAQAGFASCETQAS